jgi:hypothetical protein
MSWIAARHLTNVAVETIFQVGAAVIAERHDGIASGGVDCSDRAGIGEQQTTILAILTFPVVDAASRSATLMLPDFLSSGRVQSDDGVLSPTYIVPSTTTGLNVGLLPDSYIQATWSCLTLFLLICLREEYCE